MRIVLSPPEVLRLLRVRARLTQAEFGAKVAAQLNSPKPILKASVSAKELGLSPWTLTEFMAACAVLGVKPSEIFEEEA